MESKVNVNNIIQFKNYKYSCHRMILKTLKVVIAHFRKQGDQDVVDSRMQCLRHKTR